VNGEASAMVMQNKDQKIWLITDFSGLVEEENDTGVKSEGTMEVKSLDILKQYVGATRKITIAVKITDKKSKPIALAEVGLFIAQTNDNSISQYKYTDSEGIVLFEVTDSNPGVLNAGITGIRHPSHKIDKTKLHDKWLTIRV
jgi:hypothetical protein